MTMPISRKKTKTDPIVFAAVELGAHSVRMLIAECRRGKSVARTLEELELPIPLGVNVFRSGKVSDSAIRVICEIFENFKEKMEEYDVKQCSAVATSAVREAANANILLERIHHATGIDLQLFDGADQARLGYYTIRSVFPSKRAFARQNILLADIGTGVCQISAYRKGFLAFTESVKSGSLRVLDMLPGTLSSFALRDCLTPIVRQSFLEIEHGGMSLASDAIVAMGASARILLRFFPNAKKSTENLLDISASEFFAMRASVATRSIEQMADEFDIAKDMAEAAIPCAIILERLLRISGAKRILIPRISMKYGLLHIFLNELTGKADDFDEQILSVARMTAEKYKCSLEYSSRTVAFAEKLFLKLKRLHGLGSRDLLILKVAAWLHKTGLYLNNQASHKHSYYIILSTEIPGLSYEERRIAALTARYHRKSWPKRQHLEYTALSAGEQSRVLKLSALLRLASYLAETQALPQKLSVSMPDEDTVELDPGLSESALDFELTGKDGLAYLSHVLAVHAEISQE